jgi:hypothetical protein
MIRGDGEPSLLPSTVVGAVVLAEAAVEMSSNIDPLPEDVLTSGRFAKEQDAS